MSVHRRGETGWASSDGTCAVVGTTFLLVGLSAACAYVLTGASIPGRIDAGAQPDMDGCAAGAIVQPPADDRAYRYLELPNGMQAVVVHDPDGDMAAASIDVHTGSLSNPPELPGLAHFLEHMLFTGNEKYAGNSDYFKFITTHGGMANAATDLEVTNFHLKIPPAQIEAALDRLFQFFVSPTLKQDMTSREMHAVSSEHAKNVLQDDWRFLRLQRITTGNPNCPLRHFMTGNLDTLANATSEDLRRFWTREYTPNRFAIAVVSPHPLDVLERWVRELGAAIPARAPEPYAEFGDAPGPVPPEPSAGLEAGGVDAHGVAVGGRLIEYVPVADFDVLHLMWYLPPYERAGGGPEQEYSKKSFSYITRLLGDEGPGSVVSLLRTQRGWISSLTVYAAHPASFFSRVDVAILLTEAGLSHVDEVVQAVFAYLELLRGSEPERRRWEESKRLSDISWRFADKPAALGLAHSLSSTLGERVVPVCDALRAPYVHRTFDPDQIRAVLARLTPDTLLMYVGSKRFGEEAAADEEPPPPPELQPPPMQTERYYGVRYRVRALTAEQRELWTAGAREPSLRAQLALPPRNRFIPTEFALVGAPSAGGARDRCERVAPTPRLLGGSAGARLWSHVDRTFEQPKASVICTISAPAISADAERLWTTQLLMELTSDTLNEETYPATMAGLAAGASADIEGLQLSVGGYSGKVLDLLALAARTLSAGDSLSEARFGPIKALMLSDLRAAQYAGALDTALNKLKLILRTQTASYDRLGGVPVVEAATLDGVKAHARSLFAEGAFSECLVNGNLREEDAREAERTLRAAMGDPPPLAAPALAALRQRVYSVPVGWTVHASAALDPDETNSVAVLYYEVRAARARRGAGRGGRRAGGRAGGQADTRAPSRSERDRRVAQRRRARARACARAHAHARAPPPGPARPRRAAPRRSGRRSSISRWRRRSSCSCSCRRRPCSPRCAPTSSSGTRSA